MPVHRACILALWLGLPRLALAGQCPVPDGASPSLAARDVSERIAFIEQTLPRARRNGQRWFVGWTTGFSAVTAAQLAWIPVADDPEQTPVLLVNAASSAIGVVSLVVSPPRTIGNVRRMGALVARPNDPCAVLADAEQLLVDASKGERFGTGWLTHAGNALVGVGGGLVLGLGFEDWESAWLTTASGVVVGEIMIWTQPMDATRDLEAYRSGAWSRRERVQLRVRPQWSPRGSQLVVSGRF